MRRGLWTSLLVSGAALLGPAVEAQTPPPAPPAAGRTADGVPFDIPY